MFLVDLVRDRQLDVQLTLAEGGRKNEKELTYVQDRTLDL